MPSWSVPLGRLTRNNLIGIEVPVSHGGLGLGFRNKVRVAEILGRYSMAVAFCLINTHNVAARLADSGRDTHRQTLLSELLAGRRVGSTALTEPGAGSDFAAIRTSAAKTGDKSWRERATGLWQIAARTSRLGVVARFGRQSLGGGQDIDRSCDGHIGGRKPKSGDDRANRPIVAKLLSAS